MSLMATSEESAEKPLGTADELFVNSSTCALSFESIDSLCLPSTNRSRQSLDSVGSMDSLPRCYSIPTSESANLKYDFLSPRRFNTWTKSTWKKRYRSENNLLDLTPNKLRNVFRRTIRLNNKSVCTNNMNIAADRKPRQFRSCDGLDSIGDLLSENKTVTAVVSKGASNGPISNTPLSYCTTNSLWYPESVTTSSESLFIGHKQDFKSVCWSQHRRKSGAVYLTGSTDNLRFSGTAEELTFEETEHLVRSRSNSRRLSDIGQFSQITVKVKVPASILCSKKGFGKEIRFTLPPTATLLFLISEIEKFTEKELSKYKLCPGLVLQDCLDFWRCEEDLNLNKEIQLCTATEESPTLHFRVIPRDTSEMDVKISIALPPMVISAQFNADSTTADLLSNVINSPKLSETDLKRKMQKFGLYHPRFKVFLRTDELVSFYKLQSGDVLELKTRSQGVGGQSLYLHVKVEDENKTVLVVINSDVTVSELISKILLELETGEESKWHYYGIYLPSNESRQGGWMDDYKLLQSYSLDSVDKVELKARFRMFIFDLQVYSSSQQYTRHFVNMYISDKITAGEVLRIITSTNCLDYPTSWYGVFLHDNERISDNARLCDALENKGISKQDSLVVHMIHQALNVSVSEEGGTEHTFMVDFSVPLQQLHAIFCRYYGIRVPAASSLQHNGRILDMSVCAIKNKLTPNSSVSITYKRLLSQVYPANCRISGSRARLRKRCSSSESSYSELSSVKSTSGSTENLLSPSIYSPLSDTSSSPNSPSNNPSHGHEFILPSTFPPKDITSEQSLIDGTSPVTMVANSTSPVTMVTVPPTPTLLQETLPTISPDPLTPSSCVKMLDEAIETATRGECTSYQPTDSADNKSIPDISKLSITSQDKSSSTLSDIVSGASTGRVQRKPVDRVKRAQSKIYEEDDVNVWDDESDPEKTLIREKNGGIKSGTFNRFVELLTDTQNYQINFVKVFLLTYQAFTTPKQLLRKLIQRYNVPRLSHETMAQFTKKRNGIQSGVINCLKLWVTDGDDFENNPSLQKEFMQFIHTCVSHDNPQQYRILRQKLLLVRGMVQNRTSKKQDVVTPPLRLPPNLSPNATLFDHGAQEIARQLTMLDFLLFSKIKPIELVNQAWVKPKYSHQAKNILHFAERMNTLTRWAATSILAQKDKNSRAKMISDFINIADELLKLNNFSSFIAIINALEGSSISRLHSSWNKVDRKICNRNDELYEIILPDSNFRTLRAHVSRADPPCIPYVGLFMSDLTFATECNPTVVDGMINFVKCKYINDIINRLKLYQQKPYHFEVVPSIVGPLQQLNALDEETLYEMSLQIEPKKPR